MVSAGISVLVVDDSIFLRSFLTKILTSDPLISEVKTASDGAAAIELLATYKPDIITLDIEMPRMNGLETLKVIKSRFKIPVLMISSLTRKGASITINALELGAEDWIQKPENAFDMASQEDLKKDLLQKIRYITKRSEVQVTPFEPKKFVEPLRPDSDNMNNIQFKEHVIKNATKPTGSVRLTFNIVAIGISTGGPSALNKVVPLLPADLNAAVIIVQHMPATFTNVLSERLNEISKMKVKEAQDDELLSKGTVYVIPGDKHVRLKEVNGQLKICLDKFPKIGGFRPSAEALFYYVAEAARKNAIGVIMTGMGSDGSDNIGMIKRYSNKTIAQDEASCVIFGMPKVAIQKGNVDYILPLDKIVDKICELVIK